MPVLPLTSCVDAGKILNLPSLISPIFINKVIKVTTSYDDED